MSRLDQVNKDIRLLEQERDRIIRESRKGKVIRYSSIDKVVVGNRGRGSIGEFGIGVFKREWGDEHWHDKNYQCCILDRGCARELVRNLNELIGD